jgi:hypothetical protein
MASITPAIVNLAVKKGDMLDVSKGFVVPADLITGKNIWAEVRANVYGAVLMTFAETDGSLTRNVLSSTEFTLRFLKLAHENILPYSTYRLSLIVGTATVYDDHQTISEGTFESATVAPEGEDMETVTVYAKGDKGDRGESSYEYAVRVDGYTGTVEEYYDQISDAVEATAADVITTGNNVELTNADVDSTNADVLLTHADVGTTNADVITVSELKNDTSALKDTATTQAGIATTKAGEASGYKDTATTKASEANQSAIDAAASAQAAIASDEIEYAIINAYKLY